MKQTWFKTAGLGVSKIVCPEHVGEDVTLLKEGRWWKRTWTLCWFFHANVHQSGCFSGVVSQGTFCFPFFFHTLDCYALGVKLRHVTMHFLNKYEDPSALKPTTTGVKRPKLAKKTCTLQHGWRGPIHPQCPWKDLQNSLWKFGEGSPWFCSPENSYHLSLFMKVTHGDSIWSDHINLIALKSAAPW